MSYEIKDYNKDSIYLSIPNLIQSLVFQRIGEERSKQDKQWGIPHNQQRLWFTILSEEVGEVAKELNEFWDRDYLDDPCFISKIKNELIQVAAVCVAWLEDLERSKK